MEAAAAGRSVLRFLGHCAWCVAGFCEAGYIGEKLPRLIAVGNGPEESDAFSIPSLSVVYLPMEDMARECIQLVLGQLDGRIAAPESRLLPIEYVPRESCGPLTEYAAQ